MYRAVTFLAFVAVALSVPLFDLDEEWNSFKLIYKKGYSVNEETFRKVIFITNVKYIQKHNVEADLGQHSYWLGVNQHADLTPEEFRREMNGYHGHMVLNGSSDSTFMAPSNVKLPDTVDWRPKGYVTHVKNQGQCGSCWAFSATGSLEGQHFRKTGHLVSLSEQNLVDCAGSSYGNLGCRGGSMDNAFRYIKDNGGIDTGDCYPYKAKAQTCTFKQSCVGASITGHTDLPAQNEALLQVAVATIGPISVAIDASHISFQLYQHGVYNEVKCSPVKLDHGVLVVGYGIENGVDYWLVKNSWGQSWGEHGYIKMSRNKNNQCGIATTASYPLV